MELDAKCCSRALMGVLALGAIVFTSMTYWFASSAENHIRKGCRDAVSKYDASLQESDAWYPEDGKGALELVMILALCAAIVLVLVSGIFAVKSSGIISRGWCLSTFLVTFSAAALILVSVSAGALAVYPFKHAEESIQGVLNHANVTNAASEVHSECKKVTNHAASALLFATLSIVTQGIIALIGHAFSDEPKLPPDAYDRIGSMEECHPPRAEYMHTVPRPQGYSQNCAPRRAPQHIVFNQQYGKC